MFNVPWRPIFFNPKPLRQSETEETKAGKKELFDARRQVNETTPVAGHHTLMPRVFCRAQSAGLEIETISDVEVNILRRQKPTVDEDRITELIYKSQHELRPNGHGMLIAGSVISPRPPSR